VIDFINYLLNGLSLGCIYALIAVGYTMVYGIIKLINFAHGEFYMFGAFAGFFVLTAMGGDASGRDLGLGPLFLAMVCGGLAACVLAVVAERLVYRPLRKAGRIVALLAALGVSLFLQNAGQQTVGAKVRPFVHTLTSQRYPRWEIQPATICSNEIAKNDMSVVYQTAAEGGPVTIVENVATRGNPVPDYACTRLHEILDDAQKSGMPAKVYAYPAITVSNQQGLILLALLATSVILYFLVQHTRFGRAMRAVSHDFEAAELMGINVNQIVAGTFFTGAVVAGVGGTLAGGMYYNQIDPLMGLMPGLKAFVAAVFGGIGSIPGALLGGVILGISEKLVEAYVSSMYADTFTFGILIAVLVFRPSGLLGKPPADKV